MYRAYVIIIGMLFTLLASCGGGGGSGPPPPPPPPPDTIVSGTIEAPNGRIALHRNSPGLDSLLDLLLPTADASVPGTSPVADGTPVDLVRLDEAGAVVATLASTTTTGGQYSFNFTTLSLNFASDLFVVAMGGAGVELRTIASKATANVDAESEATVSLVFDQIAATPGTTLGNFTLQEINDLLMSVRLSAMVNGITAGVDVPTTVAAIKALVTGDAGIVAFIAAAAGASQTSSGPGDIGAYFPISDGASWTYAGSISIDGAPADSYSNTLYINGTRDVNGTDATAFAETNSSNSGELIESLLVKTDREISDWTDVANGGTAVDLVRFPLTPGATLSQGPYLLNLGADLDFDGVNETAMASATSTVIGFEDAVVAGGTFANAARIDGQLTFSGTLSLTGLAYSGSGSLSEWFAPGIGQIRRNQQLSGTADGTTVTGSGSEELTDGVFTIAANVRSNATQGAAPAAGSDGFVSVACNDQDVQVGMYANRVAGSGLISGASFVGETHYLAQCQPDNVAAAYDGSNFLVVFAKTDNANRTNIVGARVSPDGQVLDALEILVSTGISNFGPAVAFDGTNYLVVWNKFDNSPSLPGEPSNGHEIYGARISPAGVNLGEFAVFASPGEQVFASIAFDGSNYLVVWRDTRTGSGPSIDTDVYGTRVSPGGVVLDPQSVAIATAPGTQVAPQVAAGGNNWLVVWNAIGTQPVSPPPDGRIYGRRVAPDGSLLDGISDDLGIAIGTAPIANHSPALAYFNGNYFAAWVVGAYPNGGTAGIYGATISGTGQLVGGTADTPGPSISGTPPDATRYRYPHFASNGQNGLLTWAHEGGNSIDILGIVLGP